MSTSKWRLLRISPILLLAALVNFFANPSGAAWAQIIDLKFDQEDIRFEGVSLNDYTGHATALCDINGDSRSDFVIGAPGFDYMGRSGCGIVYVLISSDTMSPFVDLSDSRPDLKRIIGPSSNTQLGSVLSKGNINGDTFEDLICGMPTATVNGFFSGQVAVISGSVSLPDTIDLASPSPGVILINGENTFNKLGSSLAAGDVNNDTFDDIVAGAPLASTPAGNAAGKGYVIYGSASLPDIIDLVSPASPISRIFGENPNAVFGNSFAVADVNGDPFADIIVGAPMTSLPGRITAGVVYIIPGSSSLPDTIDISLRPPGLKRIHGALPEDLAGSVVAVGNIMGNSINDILLSAPDHSPPGRNGAGAVYAIPGSSTLPDTIDLAAPQTSVVQVYGAEAEDAIGLALASANLNADGFDELIIGAPNATPSTWQGDRPGAGKVFILFGRVEFSQLIDLAVFDTGLTTVLGSKLEEYTGGALGVGNTNSNIFDDLLIGGRKGEGVGGVLTGIANLILGDEEITPVLLLSHHVRALDNRAELYWDLFEPVDIVAFTIERREGEARATILPTDWIHEISPGSYYLLDPSVIPGEHYTYRVYLEAEFLFSAGISMPSLSARLLPNYPNPFRNKTTIPFSLPEPGRTRLRIYDVRGILVAVIADTPFEGGLNTVSWNGLNRSGRAVSSGIYFVRMDFKGKAFQRKILFLK